MSIMYSECVSVALVIQHAIRMRRIILPYADCLALTTFFPYYLINGAIFGGGGKLLNIKMCFDFLYNFCPNHFSF